jgi:hypothetical protein
METQTIQLEAFSASLHGAKILYQLPSTASSIVSLQPPWSEWIQRLRQPFRKAICLTHRLLPFTTSIVPRYDATFQVKDAPDWTLILTYMTYAPKPLLVVVENLPIPDGLWQKLTPATTLIHITHQPTIRLHPYDAIFFAPTEEVHTAYSEDSHRILQSLYRASYSLKEHREILQELRVAKAGMAWTRMDSKTESTAQRGAIYWYDPVPLQAEARLQESDLAELFSWLSEQFKLQGRS